MNECTNEIEREIPKFVASPKLTREAVILITELLMGEQDDLGTPCDTGIIFGTSVPQNLDAIVCLFRGVHQKVRLKRVYLTGGPTNHGTTEAESIFRALSEPDFRDIEFILEKTSRSTKENVESAIRLGLAGHREILFITKWFHRRRCELTLKKYLPDALIRYKGYDNVYLPDGRRVTPYNWFNSLDFRAGVWAEFLRIKTYGERGDIAYPDAIHAQVEEICRITSHP
jgi:uncharacterized SAM-binding protein YcdF (DUF218 family)